MAYPVIPPRAVSGVSPGKSSHGVNLGDWNGSVDLQSILDKLVIYEICVGH